MSLQTINKDTKSRRYSVSNKILTSGGNVVASGITDGEPVNLDVLANPDVDGNYTTVYGHFNILPQSSGFVKVQYLNGSISIIPVWEGKELMGEIAKVYSGTDSTVREFYAFI